jgi:hypothetical protein
VKPAKTLEKTYNECAINGLLFPLDRKFMHFLKSNSILDSIDNDIKTIDELKDKNRASTIYKLSYDVLHSLAEAVLFFDNVKSYNHKCLFAHLCFKHPEFGLDWDFFEKIRVKRNDLSYYGESITENDWKEISLKSHIYIKLLKSKVEKRLKERT